MRRSFLVLLPFFASAVSISAIAAAPPSFAATQAVPTADLVAHVDIPYRQFMLKNGLRVVVHTDRKAPIVAVSVWYHVGSKDEPKGKTGFAHLFEHLMFNGSENAPGDFFEPLKRIGATNLNGTTSFDRTNYFETVPTPALETALFLESDRMGHLLGAVTQQTLDNQRGVVQNEKRQGDNQPYGLVRYALFEGLFPEDHPYRHATIGSMADLDAASLDDVKNWFRAKYGPNNAVLVLAGDIDVETAKPLVEKYFGDIASGPTVPRIPAPVPTLAAPKSETLHDRVATTRIYRAWTVPGLADPDRVPLSVGAAVLGGLSSSRLDNILVRQEKIAVAVSAGTSPFESVGLFQISADVKPGVDPAFVSRRLDEIVAQYLKEGPTADEVQRVVTSQVAGEIAGLEAIGGFGGKAVALAQGALYFDDPGRYKKDLAAYAAVTPAAARAALAKWIGRPAYQLTVAPGERGAYEEAKKADEAKPAAPPVPDQPQAKPAPRKVTMPEVGKIPDFDFPDVERTKLSNGIGIIYARRAAVPMTRVQLSFDAGNAADPKDRLGTQSLMLALLDEGTKGRSSVEIAEAQERLGASIGASASMDRTSIGLSALTPNLAPSLDLLADIARNPAFAPAEVERLRGQQLARIAQEMAQPQGLALRALPPLLYGEAHPYGAPFTGTGDPAVVAKLTRDELIAFHRRWLRPDNLTILVVSDAPLADLVPLLERNFGDWAASGPRGTKDFAVATPAVTPRILLIDRPGSPQSLILGGALLPVKGRDELLPLLAANEVLGGDFLSRLNMDLRESKGWAYGASSSVSRVAETVPFIVSAPVQADRTGASIAAMVADIGEFVTSKGVTQAERDRTITGNVRELPGGFETASAVLSGMQNNMLYDRPDDYYDGLADRYRALGAADLDRAARAAFDPGRLIWVVVGDAKTVRPQLDALKLPVETVAAAKQGKE
ncbi:peptidase M16 [Sphingomonas oleivorans]|uniref:Peptidase M16 n=1 Tax=Sphingomonas oleivorans TaxID=1735121 RepID=A0A2T5FX95_9SPHN|nr:pitrilysin family protein [Sphingomonas oleivorans]PTQ10742.1 peptidase M16 [Sphingomonas oleivorans]